MESKRRPKGAKTLDNGLLVLHHIAQKPGQLTLTEVASLVGIHPTSAHRLVTSLEASLLVRRDEYKRLHPGYGLIRLAATVDQSLESIAGPFLQRLTDSTGATSYLVIAVSDNEVMAQLVVQPQNSRGHVAFSTGRVDPISRGSAGVAILSQRDVIQPESSELKQARKYGYAISKGAVVPNVIGISAPVRTPDGMPEAAIGISLVTESDLKMATKKVVSTAAEIERLLLVQ